jgi:hypothetical protein
LKSLFGRKDDSGGIKMEDKMKLIEKMRAEFENGVRPFEVAVKYKVTSHSAGSLARLLGYDFGYAPSNPREWREIGNLKRKHIGFNLATLKELANLKRFKLKSIDMKAKTITLDFE